MSTTVETVLLSTNDILGNYTTSQIEPGQKIRALNRTIEEIKRKLGLPSDETIQTIDFCEDQYFYDLNTDFDEGIKVLYHDPRLNSPEKEWFFRQYPDLLQRTGDNKTSYKWSITTINGKKQLVLVGQNINKGTLIDSLDIVGNWVVSGDGSSLEQDLLQKYSGDGSLAFTSTYSSGTITLRNASKSLSVKSLFENHAYFKLHTWLPTTNITNLKLRLYNDDSNYWTITSTTQDDGTAFSALEWIKVSFPLDNVVETGSPDYTDTVTKIDIIFTTTSGFNGVVRVDNLFTVIPDELDLIYYTSYKGTDSTGATNKIQLTLNTDKLRIGEYFDDYIELLAQGTALKVYPSIRGDKEFYIAFKQDYKEMIKDLGRRFPRKRVQGDFKTYIRR